MEKTRTALQRAIDALEGAGFHVDRAHEENERDAGNPEMIYRQERKTGAICLRVTPEEPDPRDLPASPGGGGAPVEEESYPWDPPASPDGGGAPAGAGHAEALQALGREYDRALEEERSTLDDYRCSFCAGMTTAYRDAMDILSGRKG